VFPLFFAYFLEEKCGTGPPKYEIIFWYFPPKDTDKIAEMNFKVVPLYQYSHTFAIAHISSPVASTPDAATPLPSAFPPPNLMGVES